jgi:hypothetical protein
MEIIYKNGNRLNLSYIIISEKEIKELNNAKIMKKNQVLSNNNFYNNIKQLQWDDEVENGFKCRVDKENKVNIYYFVNGLNYKYSFIDYKATLFYCVRLFDENDYPIIVIYGEKNENIGYKDFQKYFIELISQLTTVQFYLSKRAFYFSREKLTNHYSVTGKSYITNPIEETSHCNKEIITKKKLLKNRRKPTDILIYTNGRLFPDATKMIKYFQYYGGGIVVGYFGNPKKNNIIFDSGQSPSFPDHDLDTLCQGSQSTFKQLVDIYNIYLSMSAKQYYYEDLNLSIPLEYSVTPVDERVDIYENFVENNNYQLFVDEAKKILNKYKTHCNPKNKRLVLVSKDCDNKFGNEYTHGGYECGDDGKWSNNCVPSYCDDEYIFNHRSKMCILLDITDNKRKRFISNLFDYNICIYSLLFIICVVVILSYLLASKKTKKTKNSKREKINEKGEELIFINEK